MKSPFEQKHMARLNKLAQLFQDPRYRFPRRTFLAGVGAGAVIASVKVSPFGLIASAASGKTLNFVAHEDDDLLFLSPDLLHAIQAGRTVRTVYLTSGDAGKDAAYWQGRQSGEEAAYALMSAVANSWTQTDAGIAGHPISVFTLTANPAISIAFMHLPDGNLDGSGFQSTNFKSLQKLWQGTISSIDAIDGSSSYTKQALTSTLTALMSSFQPDQICTQDYAGTYGDGDHSDHHSVAYFVQVAHQQYTTPHSFTGYQDYNTSFLAANVTGADLVAKQNAFYSYARDDSSVCNSTSSCSGTSYADWLQRQYTVGYNPPVAYAGPDQTVSAGVVVTLDGSGSTDSNGNALTYQWTQTGGPSVTLSSGTVVKPTFTAPAGAATLTFQLVVNDGQQASSPASVTITVNGPQLPVASAGADQAVIFGSTVTLDGSGSTGNALTYQWTQTGGPSVTLSSSTVVKPTFTAPASVATLTFQLVVNDGQQASSPASVTITVSGSTNLAPLATVTASSQNASTGQTANKAIDGVIDGYPGDYTREWATTGGGAGSWLKLTWTSPQTVNKVVLYDRPNLNDQITGGNLQFSDGSSVAVGTLNNNGTATTITFPARTITSVQLNITAVSASTGNVGLAEIQVYGN